MLWRTKARPTTSCCSSGEAAVTGGATSGVVGTTGAVCGANQPSCGDEFAITALAVSPYNCQARVVATPRQNTTRNRARPRNARVTNEGRLMIALRDDGLIALAAGPAASRCVANSD